MKYQLVMETVQLEYGQENIGASEKIVYITIKGRNSFLLPVLKEVWPGFFNGGGFHTVANSGYQADHNVDIDAVFY